MIIYVKKEEIDSIIDRLENIQEKFWMNYKFVQEAERKENIKQFEQLYKFIWDLYKEDGIQEVIDFDLLSNVGNSEKA